MASTVNTAYAYLQAWSDTFMQDYAPGVSDQLRRFGKTTRIMPTPKRAMNGSNMEFEFKPYHNRSTRATKSLMDPMPDPGPGNYARFNVNFDHTDPNNNDFMALEIGFRTTWFDIKKRADSNFKDIGTFIERDMKEGIDDVKETFARYLHLPSDGKLATVATDGKRDADSDSWWSAGVYTADSATCLLLLEDTSIARIGDGQKVEVRTSAGALRANNLLVEYVHPADGTITVRVTADSVDSGDTPITDCDSFAATDEIFLSGNYNVSPSGTLAGLFDPSVDYYGKTRLTDSGGYRMLIPIRIDASEGGSAVALTPDMIHRAGESVGWQMGDGNALGRRTVVSARDQFRAVSRFHKDEGLTFTPALESEIGRQFNKAFGFDGLVFHDPNLGSVMWTVDDFAEYGQIDFLNMDDWEMVTPYGDGGFEMLPGDGSFGVWSRNTENDGSGRPSKVWSAQGIQLFAFVCKWPKGQLRIFGLSSPS